MTSITGDSSASIEFLRQWRPEGPWVLTAIPPAQTGLASITFGPENISAGQRWIDERINTENIYFTVNPLLRSMNGPGAKAKKSDVRGMAWLHVDVDPRPGEELSSERERALRVLREFVPRPTVIIDSGGGFQGFWRLAEEQRTDGNEARGSELEAYNLQIELRLMGAGQCWNIDRIMRLPGTINWPNEKKRKKGRVPALARVADAEWGLAYPLTAFTAAPRVQSKESFNNGGAPTVKLSGNLPRLGSLDDLPDKVTQRTKMLIVQGDDPDDPTRYGSRSEVCWAVCCELVRAGVDDDTIASILLDKDYGVSAHVLAQNRPREYAARQIKRASEEAVNPHLRRLNEEHAVIEDLGGKCRIVSEIMDHALKRTRLTRQSFDDFRNRYMNILVEIGKDEKDKPIRVQLGKFWLGHPARRQYKTLVFAPNRETPESYNLWRGFSCEARPGKCDLFLEHVHKNICSGDSGYYEYLLNWMARCVQQPDSPGEIAVVLRGGMGTGKGKFSKIFGSLWGRHFLPVSDPKHLVGNFNSHLRDCVVLFGDEAFFAGDKRHESILKTLITEETLNIEAKGVDVEVSPNYVHLILSSNSDWVVPAGADDRRFFVLDVGDDKKQDTKYFAAIDREADSGGREALLHLLMTRLLGEYEVRLVPKTAALQDQKLLSLAPVEEWWHETLVNGKIWRNDVWTTEVPKDDVLADLGRYFERQKIMRRPSPTQVAKFLKRTLPRGLPNIFQRVGERWVDDGFGQQRSKKMQMQFYELAPLTECRAYWDKRYGGANNWLPEEPSLDADKAPF